MRGQGHLEISVVCMETHSRGQSSSLHCFTTDSLRQQCLRAFNLNEDSIWLHYCARSRWWSYFLPPLSSHRFTVCTVWEPRGWERAAPGISFWERSTIISCLFSLLTPSREYQSALAPHSSVQEHGICVALLPMHAAGSEFSAGIPKVQKKWYACGCLKHSVHPHRFQYWVWKYLGYEGFRMWHHMWSQQIYTTGALVKGSTLLQQTSPKVTYIMFMIANTTATFTYTTQMLLYI